MDAMKRGRELATAMVLMLTFFHSMYASYFKQEKVAEAGYKQTSETLEGYSRIVHDEIEMLKARTQMLEAELEKAQAEKATTIEQLLKARPKKPKSPVLKAQIEGHPVAFDVAAAMPDNSAGLSELIVVDTDGIPDMPAPPDDDPLIVDMPDRPWEQQSKK